VKPGRILLAAALLALAAPARAGADDTWTDITPSVRYLHLITREEGHALRATAEDFFSCLLIFRIFFL
jgi:hypothetical protein